MSAPAAKRAFRHSSCATTGLHQGGETAFASALKRQAQLQQAAQHFGVFRQVQHALVAPSDGRGGFCTCSQQQLNRLQAATNTRTKKSCEPYLPATAEVHVSADGGCNQAADERHVVTFNGGDQRQLTVHAAGAVHVCACCQRLQSGILVTRDARAVQGLLWVLLLRVGATEDADGMRGRLVAAADDTKQQ